MEYASYPVLRPIRSGDRVATLDLSRLPSRPGQPVQLVFDGMKKTVDSLHLRLWLRSDSTKPVVVGDLYTYGEGREEETPDAAQPQPRFFPLTLSVDVTDAIRQYLGHHQADLYVEILDGQGKTVRNEKLFVDRIAVHTGDVA